MIIVESKSLSMCTKRHKCDSDAAQGSPSSWYS